MDALKLTYVDSRVPVNHKSLGTQMREMRSSLQAAYQRWQLTYLSIATYLTIVASVAIYDMLLTIRYCRSLKQLEENPIGRWLMNLDHIHEDSMPNLTLFISAKLIGTIAVLATIYILIMRSSRLGHPVAAGVSSFQLGLAAYLTFVTNA